MRSLETTLATALTLVLSACTATKEAAPAPAPAAPAPFATALSLGLADLTVRSQDLVIGVERLLTALENRDLEKARTAYINARAPYEEIEVLRAAFPELHRAIDGQAAELPGGELDPDFKGFHAVELHLFARNDHRAALPLAEELYGDVQELRRLLIEPVELDATETFGTLIERLGELAWSTVSSSEEQWSDATLTVIRYSLIGVHDVYRHFAGPLADRDAVLAEQVDHAYRKALEVIAKDFPVGEVYGTPYSIVDRSKRRRIADACISLRSRLIEAARVLKLDRNHS